MSTSQPLSAKPDRAGQILSLPWRARPVLFWRLLRDRRVPLPAKLVLPGMAAYLLMPIDLIPDFIPLLGQLDDLLVLILGLWLFLRLCPPAPFDEHVDRLRQDTNVADSSGR